MSRSLELLQEACAALPHRARKMFGGHGFFTPSGGMFAAIVTDDEIIVKLADVAARAELIALGGHPWTYTGQARPMTMAQWIVVPPAFYDDEEALAEWVRRGHALAPAKGARATRAKPSARAKPTTRKPAPATRKPAPTPREPAPTTRGTKPRAKPSATRARAR